MRMILASAGLSHHVVEDLAGHAQLANIVQQPAIAQALDLVRRQAQFRGDADANPGHTLRMPGGPG